MTTTPALVFHKPELANPLTEFVVMVHRDGAWDIFDPDRVYTDRALAEAHLAETRDTHERMLDASADSLAKNAPASAALHAALVNEIEAERAVTFAIFTRTIPPYTFA